MEIHIGDYTQTYALSTNQYVICNTSLLINLKEKIWQHFLSFLSESMLRLMNRNITIVLAGLVLHKIKIFVSDL